MNILKLINTLNKQQKNIVISPLSNILVLAGAGSGKTMILVYRIAWLISVKNYSSSSIMVVTFTNKSSTEILNRIKNVTGNKTQKDMWIGTFHSISLQILKNHYIDANLPKNFQVINKSEQFSIIKKLMLNMNIDEKKWPIKKALLYINNKKNKGIRPNKKYKYYDIIWHNIYKSYQETCDNYGLLDFSELLLRSYELFINKKCILKFYQKKFTNILVDEFQDTNIIQYHWIKILSGNLCNTMIVGDDDQSIYGWRGSTIDNIYNFINDFKNVKIFKLEQNYRSTKNILKAANAIISNNKKRMDKKLWTKNDDGELINLYNASNDVDEARFIINNIKIYKSQGFQLKNFAILYRNNYQSKILEEKLIYEKLPYIIHSGIQFVENKEIHYSICYLRLIVNFNDNYAFKNIVNKPSRGIGKKTLEVINNISFDRQLTLWESSWVAISEKLLIKKNELSLFKFLNLINKIKKISKDLILHKQIELILKQSGIWDMYLHNIKDNENTKIQKLKRLISISKQNYKVNKNHNFSDLKIFLQSISISYDSHDVNLENNNKIHLMTLHASKGLEFPIVFIIGMEEGIFPNKIFNDTFTLEEERRLAYVGITRAMQQLIITYAKNRKLYGKNYIHEISRFVNELPKSCFKIVNDNVNKEKVTYKYIYKYKKIDNNLYIGKVVYHTIFGKGIILNYQKDEKDIKLQIKFNNREIKWLMISYVKIL
ncbi:MAG: UvrD-helicase domain-containing protein [Enterobacterales bacterium]